MNTVKKSSLTAAWVSIISNIMLTILKFIVGVMFKSEVLIADGVHNAGDVIASAAAYAAMRISGQPADEDHPYGHGKAEVVSAGIVAIILAFAALYIAYHAIENLLGPPAKPHLIALVAAFISMIWKQALYVYTIRIGKRTNSKGLIATAKDHLADVYSSLAAVIGIGLALFGDHFQIPLLAYGDPISGIVVSILVLKLAYEMGIESIDILMEKNIRQQKINEYAALINSIPQVKRIDRLRAREHGHYILVDVRVGISGDLTVKEGHDISREITKLIRTTHADVDEVLVHINPWYED